MDDDTVVLMYENNPLHDTCRHTHHSMYYRNDALDNPFRATFTWKWCPISGEPVLKKGPTQ